MSPIGAMASKPNQFIYSFAKYYCNNHFLATKINRKIHSDRKLQQLDREYQELDINRVFILEKLTKFDIEIRNGYTPDQILHRFPLAFCTHITHKRIMSSLIDLLINKYKIHAIVVKAQTSGLAAFDENSAFSPDAVISAGGDGTFLEAASLIPPRATNSKGFWLFGLNTDPERSLGTLCISHPNQSSSDSNLSCGKLEPSVQKGPFKFIDLNYGFDNQCLASEITEFCNLDKFEFSQKDRLRSGSSQIETVFDYEELIYNSNVESTKLIKNPILPQNFYELTTREYVDAILYKLLIVKKCLPIFRQRIRIKVFPRDSYEMDTSGNSKPSGYIYPFGAVNDVMIADESFGKTFYAFVQFDNKQVYKVKCSGVLVSTGTGSTAWAYNMSKLSFNTVKSIANLFNSNADVNISEDMIKYAYETYNKNLKFEPAENLLKCIIREPIEDGQGSRLSEINEDNCFMAKKIKIRALSKNPKLYLDGSKCIDFYSGDTAIIAAFGADVIKSCI